MLTPEQVLELARRRAHDRHEFVVTVRQVIRELAAAAAEFTPFEHGTFLGQLRHELNSLEIEVEPLGLAAARRFRRKVSRYKRVAVFRRDNYTCRVCGWRGNPREATQARGVRAGRFLTVDHIIPEVEGGPTHVANLQTLCSRCNQAKGKTLPEAV